MIVGQAMMALGMILEAIIPIIFILSFIVSFWYFYRKSPQKTTDKTIYIRITLLSLFGAVFLTTGLLVLLWLLLLLVMR